MSVCPRFFSRLGETGQQGAKAETLKRGNETWMIGHQKAQKAQKNKTKPDYCQGNGCQGNGDGRGNGEP
jgi:hypothetical protein